MNTYKINPLAFCYTSTAGVEAYVHPSAVIVTGRGNRYDPAFQVAREGGAEVYAYLNVIERPDAATSPLDLAFYLGDVSKVPLWPGGRINFAGHVLTDMRLGSSWVQHCLDYIEALMVEGKVDGVFLDVVGARLWSTLAAWDTWPQLERDAWTAGNVDFVRQLDERRRAVNDEFKINNNSMWETPAGVEGRIYVDGICLEHHPSTRTSAIAAAGRQYSPLGHRRVFWITTALTGEAAAVSAIDGVTHVSTQKSYLAALPPAVAFNDLRLPESLVRYERLALKNAELEADKLAMINRLDRIRESVAELVTETR